MIPAILVAAFGWGSYQAPPPPLFLTGYQSFAPASQMFIPGEVAQHERRMFVIERRQ